MNCCVLLYLSLIGVLVLSELAAGLTRLSPCSIIMIQDSNNFYLFDSAFLKILRKMFLNGQRSNYFHEDHIF